ncbi:MAG: hypothetical protein IPM53_29435 [Anaerolineaceae bacterium]|nr:hypothetical protein [Anaerolineaceae bacterium]
MKETEYPHHQPPGVELPAAVKELFAETGYGCLALECDQGIIHVCHAADQDIASFAEAPLLSQWQLIKMPTAPLLRLEFRILDNPTNPYKFESFLNIAEPDQAAVADALVRQDHFTLAFFGDDLTYQYSKLDAHEAVQRQALAYLVDEAMTYWQALPPNQRDFDFAKAAFMFRFI